MSKQPKPTEATCTFDRIEVQLGVHGRTMVVEPSKSSILVESKLIWVGGKTKLAWKKLKSVKIANDGFMIESEQHVVHVFGLHDKNWPLFQKLLEKYWQRQLTARARKSEEQKQQEEEERRLKKKSYSRSYTPRFSNKGAKFLSRNENRNAWDSSDDEETFNLQRPKRKPLEEEEEEPTSEPVDADVDMQFDDAMDEQNQEQAMEDAAADAELKEREEQEEQEEAADSEAEQEQVKMPKKKKLKRKRVQDDDSDDEVFGAEITTPNPQSRTVSPHTIAKNRFADDDDDDDDENDAPQETKKVATKKSTTTTATTKTVTPTLHSFFSRPTKKTNTAAKEEAAAPPAVKRKTSNADFFNPKKASKVASPAAQDPLEESQSTVVPSQTPTADDRLEDSQSTVVPSQTPTVFGSQESSTVVPSQTPTVVASQESYMSTPATTDLSHPSTPTRKIEFPKSTSSKKTTIDEEDPLVDSPQQSTRPQVTTTIFSRRKPMLGPRRTYGSSGKKDKASMALEFADANQSPKSRQLALALSSPTRNNRFTKRAEYSPSRSLSPKRSRFWKPRDASPTRSPTKSPLATDSDPLPVPDFRGIKNIGNTCYMNSSLQMLYSVPSFAKQLTQASSNVNEHSVVSSVVQLFSELNQVQRTPASARNLKMAVDNKTNKFQGYQQRDANEFLGDLLDTMHDELVDADGKQEEEKKEDKEEAVYPTDNFFRMDVEVCLKCKSCGYSRTKEEMYRYLSLDILQKDGEETPRPNIEECLQAFFQPEDREIKCEKCEDGLVAEQTMKILSKPKAILLHLKRFAMVEQPGKDDNPPTFVLRKNKAPVELSKSLSLDPFFKEHADTKQEYKIQSIVHHIGTTADSGHYTADALREDPKDSSTQTWVSFDDTTVERVSEADVLEDKPRRRTAYMMLYTLA